MIVNAKKRSWKAYKTAFTIARSYIWLIFLKKILGKSFFDKRIETLHLKNAGLLKSSILELNGLFIKVGQLLSIMSNALPPAFGLVLESLQDNTPSSKFNTVKQILETQFGQNIDELFTSFEEQTIASASIGQVHKAVLKSGDIVAVKIQHPYIKELAKIDLKVIENLIKIIIWFFGIKGLEHVYEQVKIMIYEELDYIHEADSLKQISENCKDIDGIVIPKVYDKLCSKTVLTTKFYEGVKITNSEQLNEWNIDSSKISEKLIYTYCEMILNHGVYHADPHPGNLLVNEKGEIIILDFGAVAILSKDMPKNIVNFIQAIFTKNQDEVLNALRKMGFLAKGKEASETALQVIETMTEFFQDGFDLNNLGFEDLNNEHIKNLRSNLSIKDLTKTIQVPKDWILLERTLMLVHGVSMNIAPEYNPLDTIKPYLRTLVLKDVGLKELVLNFVKKQTGILISLPDKIDSVLTKANKGNLKFELKNFDKNTNKIYAVARQLIFVFVGVLSFGLAFVSKIYGETQYESYFTYAGIMSLVLFLYSSWKYRN